MSNIDIEPIIGLALTSGPKTAIGIKLWIELKEQLWIPEIQIDHALNRMVESGSVQAQEMGRAHKLDNKPCCGPSMLYSLPKRSAT